MDDVRLIRVVRLRATHHYGRADWDDARNRRVFGEQTRPHEHDWRVEVHVRGPVDPETGWAVDLRALDAALEEVLGGWDRGDLNVLVPEVAEGRIQPSTEELARVLYQRLASRLNPPATLVEVQVWESEEVGAGYPA